MSTLIIVTHPNLKSSVINKRWIAELEHYPQNYTVQHLDSLYPDGKINVEQEQKTMGSHDNIVFQFPFYWFNCPPLLKKWLDEVLTHGWAYGKSSDYKLKGKKIALAISTGIYEKDYCSTGQYIYTLAQLTAPFEVTFSYIKADYRSFFAFYGAEHNPTVKEVDDNAKAYIHFLENL